MLKQTKFINKHLLVIALTTSSLFLNISCNNNSTKKGSPPEKEQIPKTLQYNHRSKMSSYKPATSELKKELKIFLKSASLIPTPELIFNQYRFQSKTIDNTASPYLQLISKSCKIDPGMPTINGTLLEGQTQSSESKYFIAGDTCPISISGTSYITNSLTYVSQKNSIYSGIINGNEVNKTIIKDSSMVNKSYIREIETKRLFKVLSEKVDYSPQHQIIAGEQYSNGLTSIQFQLVDGTSVSVNTESESKSNNTTRVSQTMTQYKLPHGEIIVSVFQTGDQIEYFVNGEVSTKERINEELGLNLALQ